MRKIPALITVLGLAAVSLTGCMSVGASGCERPAAADAALQGQVRVSGSAGTEPTVSVSAPMHVDRAQTWDLATGEGTSITAKNQLVAIDIVLYDGTSGKKLVATKFDGDQSQVFAMSQWIETFPEFSALMHCASAGSRVVMALPADGVAEQAAASLGIGAGDSTLAVVDVHKVFLARATGTSVFNDAHNMPTVVRAPSGQPGIIVPDATAPKDIVVQTLIRGDGAVVKDSDTVRVNYTGVAWESGGKVFDTTWDATAASVPMATTNLPGFAAAIKGATIGSQMLVVVPADKVPSGAPSVPTGKTVVYVIDILGLDVAAAAAPQ